MRMASGLDLLLINPHGRDRIYQGLGAELTAVEPPLWCRLIGGYVLDRGYSVEIIDAEAEGWGPETIAREVAQRAPALVAMIVFGHQPPPFAALTPTADDQTQSSQRMAAASPTCR